jgi:hypothetical protein
MHVTPGPRLLQSNRTPLSYWHPNNSPIVGMANVVPSSEYNSYYPAQTQGDFTLQHIHTPLAQQPGPEYYTSIANDMDWFSTNPVSGHSVFLPKDSLSIL